MSDIHDIEPPCVGLVPDDLQAWLRANPRASECERAAAFKRCGDEAAIRLKKFIMRLKIEARIQRTYGRDAMLDFRETTAGVGE